LGVAAERQALLARLDGSFFNTVVIDFKDDWGYLSHPVPNGLAQMSGAQRWTTQDLPALVASLRRKKVRPVARVVAFKDNLVPPMFPYLAAQAAHDGSVWRNAAQVGWLDPFCAEVWAYLLDVARAAADIGFAEVQFDYLYFPHPSPAGLPKFSRPATPANRGNALAAFLSAVRGELAARNVTLSVTVAGYACHRTDDFGTGQDVARLAAYVDVLAPLVYPAHFSLGVPGCANPSAHPVEAVALTIRALRGRLATVGFAGEVRPWLQDFPWDAAGRRFDAETVRGQMQAALDSGAAGFGLWHPTGDYSRF